MLGRHLHTRLDYDSQKQKKYFKEMNNRTFSVGEVELVKDFRYRKLPGSKAIVTKVFVSKDYLEETVF